MPASPVAFVYKPIGNPTPRNCYRQHIVTMVRTAHSMGHQPIVITPSTTPAGALPLQSDIPFQLVSWDEEAPRATALAQLRALHTATPIARIFAPQESTVRFAAELRDELDIAGLSAQEAPRFLQKDLMHGRARDNGLTIANYKHVSSLEEAVVFGNDIGWPIIVKPTNRAGADGVVRIDSHLALRRHWLNTVEPGDTRLVEEYIDNAVEYHVDTMVRGGKIFFAQLSRYVNPPIEFNQNPTGSVTRRFNLNPGEAAIIEANKDMVQAFGVESGILHAEFWDRGGQAVFNEVGHRIGGAYIDRMTELATGMSLPEAWMRMELDPDFTLPQLHDARQEAGALLLPAYQSGTIASMARSTDLAIDSRIAEVSLWYDVGDFLQVPTRSTRMSGVVYAQGESSDALTELLKRAQRLFWYKTKDNPLHAVAG